MIYLEIRKDLDVFSFFVRSGTISIPESLWFEAICASFRMKKEVLLLERSDDFPTWERSRPWDVGQDWCWISPRALGLFPPEYRQSGMDFQQFKAFLSQTK